MKRTELTLLEVMLLAMTRGLAGAGLALLLAHRLTGEQRRSVGWTLLAVGAASTLPLAASVLGRAGDG